MGFRARDLFRKVPGVHTIQSEVLRPCIAWNSSSKLNLLWLLDILGHLLTFLNPILFKVPGPFGYNIDPLGPWDPWPNLEAVGCNLEAVGCNLEAVGCNLEAVGCNFETFGCKLEAIGCNLEAVGFFVPPN